MQCWLIQKVMTRGVIYTPAMVWYTATYATADLCLPGQVIMQSSRARLALVTAVARFVVQVFLLQGRVLHHLHPGLLVFHHLLLLGGDDYVHLSLPVCDHKTVPCHWPVSHPVTSKLQYRSIFW